MGNIGPMHSSRVQKSPWAMNVLKECYLTGVRMGCPEGMAIIFDDKGKENEIHCFVRNIDKWAPYLNMMENQINALTGFENYIIVSTQVDTIF